MSCASQYGLFNRYLQKLGIPPVPTTICANSNYGEATLELGKQYLSLDNLEDAWESFERAVLCFQFLGRGFEDDLTEARLSLGVTAHRRGDWTNATKYYDKVLDHFGQRGDEREPLIRDMLQQARLRQALSGRRRASTI